MEQKQYRLWLLWRLRRKHRRQIKTKSHRGGLGPSVSECMWLCVNVGNLCVSACTVCVSVKWLITEPCAINIIAFTHSLRHTCTYSCTQAPLPTGGPETAHNTEMASVSPCLSLEIWGAGSVHVAAKAWWALEKTGLLTDSQTLSKSYTNFTLTQPSAASSAPIFHHKVQHTEWMTPLLY